jgi:hypothetical protein
MRLTTTKLFTQQLKDAPALVFVPDDAQGRVFTWSTDPHDPILIWETGQKDAKKVAVPGSYEKELQNALKNPEGVYLSQLLVYSTEWFQSFVTGYIHN